MHWKKECCHGCCHHPDDDVIYDKNLTMTPIRIRWSPSVKSADRYSEKEGSFTSESMQVKSGLHFKIFTYPKVEQEGIPSVKVVYLKREGNVDGTYFTVRFLILI